MENKKEIIGTKTGEDMIFANNIDEAKNIYDKYVDILNQCGYEIIYQIMIRPNIPNLFSDFLYSEINDCYFSRPLPYLPYNTLIYKDHIIIKPMFPGIAFDNCNNQMLENILHILNKVNSYEGDKLNFELSNNRCIISLKPIEINIDKDIIFDIFFKKFDKIEKIINEYFKKDYFVMFLTALAGYVNNMKGE